MAFSPGKKYRGYSQENLAKAFKAVKEKNMPVQRAAREYGVPESTLRDRIKGKVGLQKTRSGPPPVLGVKEENKLVEYLQLLTDFGYSFSRSDVTNLATDYAVLLGKREPSDTFTHQWYYSFLSRWPGLVSKRPVGIKQQIEKASSLDCLTNYYYQLQSTLKKYNLTNSPDSLFVIDEVCINTDRSPPEVMSWKDVRWDRNRKSGRPTITLLVCGNSTGARLPGFFIFPGKTVSSESIEDCSPGTGATCSDDGSTNSSVFQLYLENHFLKFIERKEEEQPILLLYDGHRTHISPAMIETYKKQFVHMFPLPPSVSQALVDMKPGVFQDFVNRFNEESDEFLEVEFDKSIHSNVCLVACKAYKKAVNSTVLKSFFKNFGIYPFCPTVVDRGIDLSKPMLFTKRPMPKKAKEPLTVKWHSPRQQHLRKQEIKKEEDSSQDGADFEEMESEIFGGKKKKRKKAPKTVFRHNFSNRRKPSTPRVKKPAHPEEHPGSSVEKAPRLKFKLKQKEKQKMKSRNRKRMNESTTDESSEFDTESTDSEIEEMLSSDEHDIEDYDKQTRRLEFETSLREELETSRLYFEYNQKQLKLLESPMKEHSYEMHLVRDVREQPATSDQYVYEAVVVGKTDEPSNIIEEQVIEEQVVDQQVIEVQQVVEQPQTSKEQAEEEVVPNIKVESVEVEIPVSETCCVCKQYHPDKAHGYVIEFATWGKCDFPGCEHWTHLKYCCDIKVLRRHDVFHCPCHSDS